MAKLTRRKKLAFAVIAVFLGLGAIELLSLVAIKMTGIDDAYPVSTVENPFDPGRRGVALPERILERLGDTIVGNMVQNQWSYVDPRFLFRMRPASDADPDLVAIGVNSRGFRGPEFEEATGDKLRILVAGDSCAFGWRVWDAERTIDANIEKNLASGGVESRVFSIAQPGYSSYQTRLMLEDSFTAADPDYLIIYLGWNDLNSSLVTDRQAIGITGLLTRPEVRWVRRSSAYKLFGYCYSGARRKLRGEKIQVSGYARRVPKKETLENFRVMIDRSKAADCRVLILLPPFSSQIDGDPSGMINYRKDLVEAFAKDASLIRIADCDYENDESPRYFIEDGYHPNPSGAAIIGRNLGQVIRALETQKDRVGETIDGEEEATGPSRK